MKAILSEEQFLALEREWEKSVPKTQTPTKTILPAMGTRITRRDPTKPILARKKREGFATAIFFEEARDTWFAVDDRDDIKGNTVVHIYGERNGSYAAILVTSNTWSARVKAKFDASSKVGEVKQKNKRSPLLPSS